MMIEGLFDEKTENGFHFPVSRCFTEKSLFDGYLINGINGRI